MELRLTDGDNTRLINEELYYAQLNDYKEKRNKRLLCLFILLSVAGICVIGILLFIRKVKK